MSASKFTRAAIAALLLSVAAVPLHASQDAHPPAGDRLAPLAWLNGDWRGSGRAFGSNSDATLEIRPVLGGHFLELRYRTSSGFEGRGLYRAGSDGRWHGQWFDNHGSAFTIDAALAERTLTSAWGAGDARNGRTIYRLTADGRLEVIDTITGRDGQTREFARHMLTRAP